ncbi:hypothetical protein SK128_009587, partial [Halocaridina rubra]
ELYLTVKLLWEELWKLPGNIPLIASELLHANLTYHLPDDISKSLLVLLAANIRKIALVPTSRQLVMLKLASVFNHTHIIDKEYQVQEFDVRGVDFCKNVNTLQLLLPMCVHLTVLKLGCNTTPQTLEAVKCCPLKELSITERQAHNPRVPSEYLLNVLLGTSYTNATAILQSMRDGENVDINPTWPNLFNLSLGYCRVNQDFVIVLLIFLKKLKYVESSIVRKGTCLWQYYELKKEMNELPKLALEDFYLVELSPKYVHMLSCITPNLVKLYFFSCDVRGLGMSVMDAFQNLSENLKYLKELTIYNVRHICPGEPPLDIFSSIGKGIKTLILDGCIVQSVDLEDMGNILNFFPSVENLKLFFRVGLHCMQQCPPKIHCFPSVTSLTVRTPKVHEGTFPYMFQMFPNIQKLTLMDHKSEFSDTYSLGILSDLRVMKFSDINGISVSELMKVPFATQDRRCWELHMPAKSLPEEDIKRLVCSGWNFFPISEYVFDLSL